MNSKWRFPGNNYTADSGIDTPDMETFAKEPISSLARESVQNSIDAQYGDKYAKVEFKTFTVSKKDIPGIDDIEKEIDCCIEYQKDKKDYETLKKMKASISKDKITCLRISDFNTRGLEGVDKDETSPFYLLTKGTGLSSKSGTMGGSKGIGKFASFVTSSINTVFYSTLNIDNQEGSIGICKLCSRRMDNSDEKTQGLGYYAIDKKNKPELKQTNIDKFVRKEPGTDIYIIGFKKNGNWKKEAITKVLDSFMCAFYYGRLEVIVEDTIINKSTLASIVNDSSLILSKEINNVVSQYMLLSDDSHIHEEIEIDDYGTVDLYIKSFDKDNLQFATRRCVMVRYPYMKIMTFPVSNIPCSALCVIRNDELNKTLRKIENPQHTDWEFNRIDDAEERRKIRQLVGSLKDKIKKAVYDHLQTGEAKEADIEGANDFLPYEKDDDNSEILPNGNVSSSIVAENQNIQQSNSGNVKDENSEFMSPSLGTNEDENDDTSSPSRGNKGEDEKRQPLDGSTGHGDGDNELLEKKQLGGLKYNLLAPNIKTGEYIVCFNSIYSESDCELEFNYLDDSGAKYKPIISKCVIDGKEYEIKDNIIQGIKLENNKKYIIHLYTDMKEYYSCEVKMYANTK